MAAGGLPAGYRLLWLLYTVHPPGAPPRRWRGLVGYGRLDIAARFLLAALYPGGKLLDDSALFLFLDRGGSVGEGILFEPRCLPEAMDSEAEAGELLLAALRGRGGCSMVPDASLRGLLLAARRRGYRVVLLSEEGGPINAHRDVSYVLVVGSRVDPPRDLPVDEAWRIGCMPYLASTVAAYINLELRAMRQLWGHDEG